MFLFSPPLVGNYFSLLSVSEQATNVVKWISVGSVFLLLGIIALLGFFSKQTFDARRLAFAGICIATSFSLSFVKFKFAQFGGSITIASFVPILIYAYAYGVLDGVIVGLIHGLLNFIESPYILTPATFILDYLLPFASVGLMGFFKKTANITPKKKESAFPIILGCICVFSARFIFHLLSGVIFFLEGAIWTPLPDWAMQNAFFYSFLYQCVYIPADALIATMVLAFLQKSGVLSKLITVMKRKK